MTEQQPKRGFAWRHCDPDSWVRASDRTADRRSSGEFSARLTIDITPALRGRITVAALRRDLTVAEMPWALLARELSGDSGTAS